MCEETILETENVCVMVYDDGTEVGPHVTDRTVGDDKYRYV
jgi:hypothetical protein